MKYIIILIITILLNSCRDTYDTYTIKNSTNYNVLILAYQSWYEPPFLTDEIIIKPNDLYYRIKDTGEGGTSEKGVFLSDDVDSVIMVFNSVKKIVYVCKNISNAMCTYQKNIMNWREYYDVSCEEKRGCDYIYTITEEDYEMADSIK